jgi:hypothetical protein
MAGVRARPDRPRRRPGSARDRHGARLYDAAFATLTALFGREARGPITGITPDRRFASTVGWPLSVLLNDSFDGGVPVLGRAALNLVVCPPINRFWFRYRPPFSLGAAVEAAAPLRRTGRWC